MTERKEPIRVSLAYHNAVVGKGSDKDSAVENKNFLSKVKLALTKGQGK